MPRMPRTPGTPRTPRTRRFHLVSAAAFTATIAVLATLVTIATSSCTQTPINVPLRTFERAQRIDVVCMRVYRYDPGALYPVAIPPEPTVEADCAPVPPNTDGSFLPNHLFALVTQSSRGEVAVVDLTRGAVVDLDRSTPGINFLVVGHIPTDIAVAPDGQMTFVAAAEPNKAAIYGISNREILGDSQGDPSANRPVPDLTSWPVCALPQAPGPIAIIPRAAAVDGGGAEAAAGSYDIAVVLPGNGRRAARVITIDPAPFLRGAKVDTTPGRALPPGSLEPCPITGAIELGKDLPPSFQPGPSWDDGIKYDAGAPPAFDAGTGAPVDGGAEPVDPNGLPRSSTSCSSPLPDVDAGVDGGDDAGFTTPIANAEAHGVNAVADGHILYVADDALPVIHVIDMASPGAPREIDPLLATSIVNPSRKVSVGTLTVSPPTRDYRRFLYALDKREGSIIVYDVTDIGTSPPGTASSAPHVPLTRPHPETNPFQPPDRILFNVPVAAISFARHDFAPRENAQVFGAAKRGLLCNPNDNAGTDPAQFVDPGAFYRANVPDQIVALGPYRLRGVFGFATLSNGTIVTIDVDDWDAPCRRPADMSKATSSVAPPQPVAAPGDLDPYHAPTTDTLFNGLPAVTDEDFYPVSAPHRPRSSFSLRRDSQTGVHIPNLVSVPQILDKDAPLPNAGPSALRVPLMLPAASIFPDPPPDLAAPNASLPPTKAAIGDPPILAGIRFAWEDPQAHIDQDWSVTYEGALPGFEGIATAVSTTDAYQTLTLTQKNGLFCRRGVEDQRMGQQRASAQLAAMSSSRIPQPEALASRLADYVQITDPILPLGDPYWRENPDETGGEGAGKCWPDDLSPDKRQALCSTFYLAPDDPNAVERDFPVVEAYDDHLVVGRYYRAPADATGKLKPRQIVSKDPTNVEALRAMRCCFHHQVRFKVRSGGTWLTTGSAVGYMHHVTKDATTSACVESCDPREALLNSRVPSLPRSLDPLTVPPNRNSVLALRNPMFGIVMWDGIAEDRTDIVPTRDLVWKFTTRGQFVPLTVNLAAATTAVSPQSMRFIDTLQQIAVVDGSTQGLVLIDLNTVAQAHAPYF
jgi:hypothetical protein